MLLFFFVIYSFLLIENKSRFLHHLRHPLLWYKEFPLLECTREGQQLFFFLSCLFDFLFLIFLHFIFFRIQNTTQTTRILDPESVRPGFTNPIYGIKDAPDLSFRESFTFARNADPTIPDLQFFLDIAHSSASSPGFCTNSKGLSQDQVALLHLYTQESPFYSFINGLLRERNRECLKHMFPVLKIMLTALSSLPKEPITVYRGVKANLVSQFPVEKKFVWWSITSTSASLGTLQSPQFLGRSGERTLFAIKTKSAVKITEYSALGEGEDEWLLPPG